MHAFDILSDPVRRRILELLADGEQTAGALTEVIRAEFGISQPAVSQHLRVLRESGFITVRAEGARRLYAVAPAPLREVDAWLERFARFWSQPLDALATELARGKRELRAAESANASMPSNDDRRRHGGHMIDITRQLNAIYRKVETLPPADGLGERVSVLLRRAYDAPLNDVWDAVTEPDRITRWFMPISGEFRVGGTFQLEGNAGGDILACEPPRLLRVTFGGPTSLVEIRLTAHGVSGAVLELEHTVPIEMAESVAGALYVGPGWDSALVGLDRFLRGEAVGDPVAAANSAQAQEFSRQSVHAWAVVVKDSGAATPEQLAAATAVSLAQFAPDKPTT